MSSLSYFLGILAALCMMAAVIRCQTCEAGANCSAQNECCLLDKSTGLGKCSPMGDVADLCYVKQPYAWSKPEEMISDFDLCPCETGYFCGSIWQVDPVYGEKGICTFG